MTNFSGIGGPSFKGTQGIGGVQQNGGNQAAAKANPQGSVLNTGPKQDTVSFSFGSGAGPSHNVNFGDIAALSMEQCAGKLHSSTFAKMQGAPSKF